MVLASASPDSVVSAAVPARPRRRRNVAEAVTGWAFALPAVAIFAVFMFVPLVWAVVISLKHTSGFGVPQFIGLGNYRNILSDTVFWRSLLNTAVYTAVTVPVGMGLGLAVALLLNAKMPGRGLLRAVYYLPVVISGVASAIIANWMFNEDFGVVDRVLGVFGLHVHWQSQGVPAMASIVLVSVWIRLGFDMVIYLAGLQGIPGELYEAARVDGASAWQTFRLVTWPSLRSTTFFLMVIEIITSFQIFDLVYVMTGGGPGVSTSMLVTYAYSSGFEQRQQGYAAALGVVLYVIVLAFTLVQWRFARRRDAA